MTLRYNANLVAEGAIKDSKGNKITDTYTETYSATNPVLTSTSNICTWTLTHNLGSNVEVHVYDSSTNKEVMANITLTSSTAATIELFSTADIAAAAYTAIAIGK